MKKKIIGIFICTLMIGMMYVLNPSTVSASNIDQEQTSWDQETIIYNNDNGYHFVAQSFKPSESTLCSVDVFIRSYYSPSESLTLSIRSDLSGSDLASLSKAPSQIPTSLSWVNFDFTDISVTVDNTYYIVLEMDYNPPAPKGYLWAYNDGGNPYSKGCIWDKSDIDPWTPCYGDSDATFRTYGYTNNPPNTPSTPTGPGSLYVGVTGTYCTSATDPDGDQVQIRFDWDASGSHDYSDWSGLVNSGTEVCMDHSWSIAGTYVVKAQARDEYGETSGWSDGKTVVVIAGNQPPIPPYDPGPAHGATNVDINTDIWWYCYDPDGDPLTYDIYFGPDSNPPLIKSNYAGTYWTLDTLEWDTKYYWKIVAKDDHDHSTTGPIWSFTTIAEQNYPPYEPSNPSPAHGATDVDVEQFTFLSWTGGDPNQGDTVTYDVCFGLNMMHLVLVSEGQSATSYNAGTLEFEKTYFWEITAWDNHGAFYKSPIWQFTTEEWDCSDLPNLYFPRANWWGSDKTRLYAFVPIWWDLNEADYPSYGYRSIYSKAERFAISKVNDKHCGDTEPVSGIGIPETYIVETSIGHKYTLPSCGSGGDPLPCRVRISGQYGMDGLAGLLETNWLGRADIHISLIIKKYQPIRHKEYTIGHYGVGPIEDYWHNIQDSFTIQSSEDIQLHYGQTYTFYLRTKVTIFLTSQGVPFAPWLPKHSAKARAEIGATFDNIQISWQPALKGDGGNNPPDAPGESFGSMGIVDEEHLFHSNGSVDPDGDQVYYKWHWDDGSTSEWLGPYDSGDPVSVIHTYTKPGAYNVRLEAEDVMGAWSGLSNDSYCGMLYPAGEIIVDVPASGDEWRDSSLKVYPVIWRRSGFTGDHVRIVLCKGDALCQDLTPDLVPNSGSYDVRLGYNLASGDDYRIVVYDLTNAANCSSEFTIIWTLSNSLPSHQNNAGNNLNSRSRSNLLNLLGVLDYE